MRLRSLFLASALLVGCGGDSSSDAGADGGADGGADCAGSADGTACGSGRICLSGTCAQSVCGDEFVDALRGEECEDGNDVAFDGCNPGSCTFTCTDAQDCSDGDPCSGSEECSSSHVCVAGTALEDGVVCATPSASGMCRDEVCVAPGCGNDFVDDGEECDDGNDEDGDGCDADCTFTCDATEGCEDGNVCNGVAICQLADHTCMPGTAPNCNDDDPCTTDSCDPVGGCVHTLVEDLDGDGFVRFDHPLGCGDDCDDGDPTRYPTATELCDAVDQNCDGNPTPTVIPTWYEDCDGDGYALPTASGQMQCDAPTTGCGTFTARVPTAGEADCDDTNADVRPRATEIAGDADDVDEDCSGTVMCIRDADSDGVVVTTAMTVASLDDDCLDDGEARLSAPTGDCDDADPTAYPDATEIASDTNDADENCDGVVTCLADNDGDGYGAGMPSAAADGDCADAGEAHFPTRDVCPGVSDDQVDADGDGEGDACDLCPDTPNADQDCPTIYDLKDGTIVPPNYPAPPPPATQPPPGPRFTFRNVVVTALRSNAYFVQVPVGHRDYAGPEYSGIMVFTGPGAPLYTDGTAIQRGDNVDVTGRFIAFNGQLELSSPITTVRSTFTRPIPDPVRPVLPSEVSAIASSRATALEGVLIEIGPTTVTSTAGVSFTLEGVLRVDNFLATYPIPAPGPLNGVRGVLVYRLFSMALSPRSPDEVF
jgi:cysteine-rich repeat protein